MQSAIGVTFVILTIPRLIRLQILMFENRKLAVVSPIVLQFLSVENILQCLPGDWYLPVI
jgi:hypothetical protein